MVLGNDLLDRFKEVQKEVRPAVEVNTIEGGVGGCIGSRICFL